MNPLNVVQIVGAPVACGDGVKEAWREIVVLAQMQLSRRFGDTIRVDYFDLFDPGCPPLPLEAQLPLVPINGLVFSCGGKISIPAIRKQLEPYVDQKDRIRPNAGLRLRQPKKNPSELSCFCAAAIPVAARWLKPSSTPGWGIA